MKNLITLIIISILTIFASHQAVFAQTFIPEVANDTNYTLIEPLPCLDNGADCVNGNVQKVTFQRYLNLLFLFTFSLAAIASVTVIVLGGLQYMTTDAVSGKTDGKERIKNAIFGLFMIIISYSILNTIDPNMVKIPKTLVPKLQNVEYESLQVLAEQNDLMLRIAELKEARGSVASTTELANKIQKLADNELLPARDRARYHKEAQELRIQSVMIALEANLKEEKIKINSTLAEAKLGNFLTGGFTYDKKTQEDFNQHMLNIERMYDKSIKDEYIVNNPEQVKKLTNEKLYTKKTFEQQYQINQKLDLLEKGEFFSNDAEIIKIVREEITSLTNQKNFFTDPITQSRFEQESKERIGVLKNKLADVEAKHVKRMEEIQKKNSNNNSVNTNTQVMY
jgi:hypothetical protein